MCVSNDDVYGAPSLIELRKCSVWKRNETMEHTPPTRARARAREKRVEEIAGLEKWKGENAFCGAGTNGIILFLFVV